MVGTSKIVSAGGLILLLAAGASAQSYSCNEPQCSSTQVVSWQCDSCRPVCVDSDVMASAPGQPVLELAPEPMGWMMSPPYPMSPSQVQTDYSPEMVYAPAMAPTYGGYGSFLAPSPQSDVLGFSPYEEVAMAPMALAPSEMVPIAVAPAVSSGACEPVTCEQDKTEQCSGVKALLKFQTGINDCCKDALCKNCHSNGCSQCCAGSFKLSYARPCQSCCEYDPNCLFCQDFQGCGQCKPGYKLMELPGGVEAGQAFVQRKCVPV